MSNYIDINYCPKCDRIREMVWFDGDDTYTVACESCDYNETNEQWIKDCLKNKEENE